MCKDMKRTMSEELEVEVPQMEKEAVFVSAQVADIACKFGGLGGSVVAVLFKHSVVAVQTARFEPDCVNGCV